MLHATGPSAGRVVAVVPATLLVVFAGLLVLIGLPCDKGRRQYVMKVSGQAMNAASAMMQGRSAELPTASRRS